MSLTIWREPPPWWNDFLKIINERVEIRGRLILTKGLLLRYLLKVNAIDLRDRGYRTTIAMTRQALLDGRWNNGLKAIKLTNRTIKVVKDGNDDV